MQAQNRSLEGFWCEMAPKLGQNRRSPFFSQVLELCFQQRNLTEAMFYSGFKRTFLTSGVTPAEVKNGSVGPARPCCFPVLKLFFWKVPEVFHVYNSRVRLPKLIEIVFFCLFHALGWQNLPQNHVFSCEVVLYVTFWHRGWEKCVSKMGPSNRPGHAVSYSHNLRAIGDAGSKPWSRGVLVRNGTKTRPKR